MKKLVLLIILTLTACQTSDVSLNNALNDDDKQVITKNEISDFTYVNASDGILILFDKNDKFYRDAITIIPHNLKDKIYLLKFLNSSDLSFEYQLNTIRFYHSKKAINFVVHNKLGQKLFENLKTKHNVYYCDQLAYAKNNRFLYPDTKQSTQSVNVLLSKLVNNSKYIKPDCTSGGEGATACSVGDIYSKCSVSCGEGYYACCKSANNTCECIEK